MESPSATCQKLKTQKENGTRLSQTINRYTFKDAYPLLRIDEQVNALAQCKVFSTLDLKFAYYQISIAEEDRPYTAFEADVRLYHYCRLPFGVTNGVSAF